MKLEMNNRNKLGKLTNMQELSNTFLNNQVVKEEITKEIRKYLGKLKVNIQHTKMYEIQLKQCLERIYSYKHPLLKKKRGFKSPKPPP